MKSNGSERVRRNSFHSDHENMYQRLFAFSLFLTFIFTKGCESIVAFVLVRRCGKRNYNSIVKPIICTVHRVRTLFRTTRLFRTVRRTEYDSTAMTSNTNGWNCLRPKKYNSTTEELFLERAQKSADGYDRNHFRYFTT